MKVEAASAFPSGGGGRKRAGKRSAVGTRLPHAPGNRGASPVRDAEKNFRNPAPSRISGVIVSVGLDSKYGHFDPQPMGSGRQAGPHLSFRPRQSAENGSRRLMAAEPPQVLILRASGPRQKRNRSFAYSRLRFPNTQKPPPAGMESAAGDVQRLARHFRRPLRRCLRRRRCPAGRKSVLKVR